MEDIIKVYETQTQYEYENGILKAVRKVGFDVSKERLETALFDSRRFYNEGYNDARLEYEQKWIPCSERLPEKDGTYLVSGIWGSGKLQVGECEYKVSDGYFDTYLNFDIVAWRELPEPYSE